MLCVADSWRGLTVAVKEEKAERMVRGKWDVDHLQQEVEMLEVRRACIAPHRYVIIGSDACCVSHIMFCCVALLMHGGWFQRLRHPNLVMYLGSDLKIPAEEDGGGPPTLSIVTEFCPGGASTLAPFFYLFLTLQLVLLHASDLIP